MSHPEQVILKDSRGLIVQATIAKDHDNREHFACCFCDGDFLSLHSWRSHHQVDTHLTPNTISEPQPIIKMENAMETREIVEILSDDEMETISISSDEPEEVEPNTSANEQSQVIVTSGKMQNDINGSANMTNGEVIKQSQTNEPQPSTSKQTPKQSAENSTAKIADSIANKQSTIEVLTNGTQSSDQTTPQQQQQSQQQVQSKPSTSKEANGTKSEESDDDVSSISSIESMDSTSLKRSENNPDGNRSNSTKNYPCKYCAETFGTYSKYRKHENSCETWQKSMFVCPVEECSKKYARIQSRDHHIDEKHENFGFRCGICPRHFLSEKEKQEHQIKKHSNNKIIPCLFCKRICYSNYQRKCHRKKHHPDGEYECPVCEQSYKSKEAMLKHKKDVHSK